MAKGVDPGSQHLGYSAAERSLTFIERFISTYYMRQPRWLRSLVFLFFVLLFIYSVLEIVNGKHTLDTTIGVKLSQEELLSKKALLPATSREATRPAPPGYAVLFDEREYGTNSHGWLRLDLDTAEYAAVLATGRLGIKVLAPDVGMVDYDISFDRMSLKLQPIILAPPAPVGSELGPERERRSAAVPASIWGPSAAFADEITSTPDRLFIRSITLGKQAHDVQDLSMEFEAAGRVSSLKGFLTDQNRSVGSLPLFGGSSVYDYVWFLEVPTGTRSGKVIVKSRGGWLRTDYEEEFSFAVGDYGVPVAVKGTRESTLVLQRMLPYDVVLFERLGTADLSAKVGPELNKLGFVVRVNSGSSKVPGEYNVLYAGSEVPFQAVQKAVQRINDLGVRLRYLQYNLKLKSPTQNQIQVGSNIKFRCLEPLSNTAIQRLSGAKSENDFIHTIEESAPKKLCPGDSLISGLQ